MGRLRAGLLAASLMLATLAVSGCLSLPDSLAFGPLFGHRGPPVEAHVIDPAVQEPGADKTPASLAHAAEGASARDATERSFAWREGGRDFVLTATLDTERYEEARARPRSFNVWGYAQYAADPGDDDLVRALASGLAVSAAEAGFGAEELPQFVLGFVQGGLGYVLDNDSVGVEDYPRYPVETLVDGAGDCEDLSFLYAAILHELGYGAALLLYDGHLVAGVDVGARSGAGGEADGRWYAYAEPTAPGWRVGDAPDAYRDATPIVLRIENQPILEFSWRIRYDPDQEAHVLDVTFLNNGTATAKGVRFWSGVEAAQGGVWSQRWFSVPEVPAQGTATKSYVLAAGAPAGAEVRLRGVVEAPGLPYFEATTPWAKAP